MVYALEGGREGGREGRREGGSQLSVRISLFFFLSFFSFFFCFFCPIGRNVLISAYISKKTGRTRTAQQVWNIGTPDLCAGGLYQWHNSDVAGNSRAFMSSRPPLLLRHDVAYRLYYKQNLPVMNIFPVGMCKKDHSVRFTFLVRRRGCVFFIGVYKP